jgi:WhiB family transcriptional regulator, redox-sensing transcriptional regulator
MRKETSPWKVKGSSVMRSQLAVTLAEAAYPGRARTGPNWRRRALCRDGVDSTLFFSPKWAEMHRAKAMCDGCPVVVDCLEHALKMPFRPAGVWGGTTKHQRDVMIRDCPVPPPPPDPVPEAVRPAVVGPPSNCVRCGKFVRCDVVYCTQCRLDGG